MKSSDLTSTVGKFLLIYFPLLVMASGMNAQTTETFSGGTGTPGQTTGNPGSLTFNTFDFTASTLSGLDAFLRPDAGGYAQFTGSRLSEITIKLNAGGSFSLDQILFEAANTLTVDDDITVTGYSSTFPVSGATTTFKVPGAIGTEKAVDFTGIAAFGNVDELRITIADDGSFGGLRIESITTDAAVTPCSSGTSFIVDFESESWTNNQNIGSSITSKEIVLSYFSSGTTPKTMLATVGGAGPQDNVGLAVNNVGGNGDTFEIKSSDGCDFDFKSFYTYTNFVSTVTITGYRDNNQIVQSSGFSLQGNGTNSVSSVLAGFKNVDRVVLTNPNSGGFGFFNGFDDLSFGPAVASDGTAPVFESGTPSSSGITQTGLSLSADIDEAGIIYYVVVANGASTPTAAQVKAGTDASASEPVTKGNAMVTSGSFSNNFSITGLSAVTAYDIYVVAEDDESTPNLQAVATRVSMTTLPPGSLLVAATVFLEGAYNGTNLNTTLNTNIPTTQTYTNNGHAGAESVGSIPANAVDWVLVELREAGSAAAALNSTKVGSAAGFLMNDGTIKATDGTSNLTVSLSGNSGAEFYVVIYHRNHLPIMSANAITESSSLYTIDFTSASTNVYQGTTGLASLSGGKFGMLAGDADGDGDVDATDLITWQSQNGNSFTYNTTNGDFNLDGEINAVDRNDFQQKNNSKTSQVPAT